MYSKHSIQKNYYYFKFLFVLVSIQQKILEMMFRSGQLEGLATTDADLRMQLLLSTCGDCVEVGLNPFPVM